MAVLYFAKININQEIYEVYHQERDYQKELNRIYEAIKEEATIEEGGPDGPTGMLTFAAVNKDPEKRLITGRLVRVEPGPHTTFDRQKHDVIDTFEENKASYITFFLDVQSETIAFVTKRDFGFKMFLSGFTALLSESSGTRYEIFLISDKREFRQKVDELKSVQSITILAVPPNNDRAQFEELFAMSTEDARAMGLGKLKQELQPGTKSGLHLTERLWKAIEYAITGGGKTDARGISSTDKSITVSSEEDTPYKKSIPDRDKDSQEAIRLHGEEELNTIISMQAWRNRKD